MIYKESALIWEAYNSLNTDKVVDMVAVLYLADSNGFIRRVTDTRQYPKGVKINPTAIAADIRSRGVQPNPLNGMKSNGESVILCTHGFFDTDYNLEKRGGKELTVTFKKKLSEIFLDTDEFERTGLKWSMFGIPADKIQDASNKYYALLSQDKHIQKNKAARISLNNFSDVLDTNGKWPSVLDNMWMGCFVENIKPAEITGIYYGKCCRTTIDDAI